MFKRLIYILGDVSMHLMWQATGLVDAVGHVPGPEPRFSMSGRILGHRQDVAVHVDELRKSLTLAADELGQTLTLTAACEADGTVAVMPSVMVPMINSTL